MKHSKKSNQLHDNFKEVDDFGFLTDKQKREEKRRLKKSRSKLERRESKYDYEDYD